MRRPLHRHANRTLLPCHPSNVKAGRSRPWRSLELTVPGEPVVVRLHYPQSHGLSVLGERTVRRCEPRRDRGAGRRDFHYRGRRRTVGPPVTQSSLRDVGTVSRTSCNTVITSGRRDGQVRKKEQERGGPLRLSVTRLAKSLDG